MYHDSDALVVHLSRELNQIEFEIVNGLKGFEAFCCVSRSPLDGGPEAAMTLIWEGCVMKTMLLLMSWDSWWLGASLNEHPNHEPERKMARGKEDYVLSHLIIKTPFITNPRDVPEKKRERGQSFSHLSFSFLPSNHNRHYPILPSLLILCFQFKSIDAHLSMASCCCLGLKGRRVGGKEVKRRCPLPRFPVGTQVKVPWKWWWFLKTRPEMDLREKEKRYEARLRAREEKGCGLILSAKWWPQEGNDDDGTHLFKWGMPIQWEGSLEISTTDTIEECEWPIFTVDLESM